MSAENVAILRRSFDAFERGDLPGTLADVSENLVTHAKLQPDARTLHGREGFLEAFANWTEGFDRYSLSLEELVDAGGAHVIAHTVQRGVGKQSGAPIEGHYWLVFELAEGEIVTVEFHASKAAALAATRPG